MSSGGGGGGGSGGSGAHPQLIRATLPTSAKREQKDKCTDGGSSAAASLPNPAMVEEEVRKSIVRISFKFNNIPMVIAGVITSVNDKQVDIIAESTLVKRCKERSFTLNFPLSLGYDVGIKVRKSSLRTYGNGAITRFVVKRVDYAYDMGFIKEVVFAIEAKSCDDVNTFVFPREDFLTPTGYWPGSIIHGSRMPVGIVDCPAHEYAHCGSPVFDKNGFLVGMCNTLQCQTHLWTMDFLKTVIEEIKDEDFAKKKIEEGKEFLGVSNPTVVVIRDITSDED